MDVDDLPDEYYVLTMNNGKGFWLSQQAGIRVKQFIVELKPTDELKAFSFIDLSGSQVVIMAGAIADLYYSTPETRQLDKELIDRDYPAREY